MARRISKLPQHLERDKLANMVLRTFGSTRWTQDSPVVPDVWIKFVQSEWDAAYRRIILAEEPEPPEVDLLLTPWTGAMPGQVARRIRQLLAGRDVDVAPGATRVAAKLDFAEMFTAVLPLTGWWQRWVNKLADLHADAHPGDPFTDADLVYMPQWWLADPGDVQQVARGEQIYLEWLRLEVLAGFIALIHYASTQADLEQIAGLCPHLGSPPPQLGSGGVASRYVPLLPEQGQLLVAAFARMLLDPPLVADRAVRIEGLPDPKSERIWMVNLNRSASTTMFDSRKTVKADAAQRLFETGGRGITVAVIDIGIDALHFGFADRGNPAALALMDGDEFRPEHLPACSRVRATYDFTLLRELMSKTANGTLRPDDIEEWRTTLTREEIADALNHLHVRAKYGRGMDWALVEPLIRMPHDWRYNPNRLKADHGTHVAGIVAADLPEPPELDKPIRGMVPEATLYDLRVFDGDGHGSEYAILGAIEFVAWLNRNRNEPVIHAVNLSLALAHDVDSFACGRTPICDACNQLVGSGTVVVAAAGNTGFENAEKQSLGNGFRTVSITDPGNADDVITVGSTHRRDPHAYGVSYFSSRGPTADGRRKPDLLAPGEKINSTTLYGQTKPLDGTSMAAPHVTGAAALLMARYPELIGQPRKIKQVLMQSATDLGREPSFQGAGLLDVLRALQSV